MKWTSVNPCPRRRHGREAVVEHVAAVLHVTVTVLHVHEPGVHAPRPLHGTRGGGGGGGGDRPHTRGLHSSTIPLNLSAFCGTGNVFRGG